MRLECSSECWVIVNVSNCDRKTVPTGATTSRALTSSWLWKRDATVYEDYALMMMMMMMTTNKFMKNFLPSFLK